MIWRKLLVNNNSKIIDSFDNLLSVLKTTFSSGVKETHEVAAAHVRNFVDSIVPTARKVIRISVR